MKLTFVLNGKTTSLEVAPDKRLLDLLREDLHMTGTKEGCGEGECGAKALLMHNPHPTVEEIRVALSGNICRCSGYSQIIRAVQRTAREMEEEQA